MSIKDMDITTKDIVLSLIALFGAVSGGGTAYYESQIEDHTDYGPIIEQLRDENKSLEIQVCLLINEVNRQAGRDALGQCTL